MKEGDSCRPDKQNPDPSRPDALFAQILDEANEGQLGLVRGPVDGPVGGFLPYFSSDWGAPYGTLHFRTDSCP